MDSVVARPAVGWRFRLPHVPNYSTVALHDHSYIANTIRGFKVSLSIVLQAISQLKLRYGRDYS